MPEVQVPERSEVAKRIGQCEIHYDKSIDSAKAGWTGRWVKCAFCGRRAHVSIVTHLKKVHPEIWDECVDVFRRRREAGWSLKKIMWEFKRTFSWSVIVSALNGTEAHAPVRVNVKRLEPNAEEFAVPRSSMWSFPRRGTWANHDSQYRGNWAPQVPRALILRYTKESDLVLDPFVGGGTTAIEALLLGRHFVGVDVNVGAIKLTETKISELRARLGEYLPGLMLRPGDVECSVRVGDARNIAAVPSGAVQLACLHPPYLDMVQYTKRVRTDLSTIYDAHQFCREMERIAQEMLRVLRPGGFCGLLIGDVRRKGRFVPLGFLVMSVFIRSGFGLLEVNVKEQHKTAMAEFWKRKDTFTRLEHEYLFVFQKPQVQHLAVPTDPDTAAQNGKNNGYDPFVGVVECLKGYGRVVFGQDGFCPVAGYSVYTTPCSRCSVPSKWPTPPLVSETTVETAKPEPKARKAPRAKRPALRVRGKN